MKLEFAIHLYIYRINKSFYPYNHLQIKINRMLINRMLIASPLWLHFLLTVTYFLIFSHTLAADSNSLKAYFLDEVFENIFNLCSKMYYRYQFYNVFTMCIQLLNIVLYVFDGIFIDVSFIYDVTIHPYILTHQ